MASMRDIKRRKESVQSTEQITKAMKLVSSVTLPAVMVPVRGGVLIPLTVTVSVFVAVPP